LYSQEGHILSFNQNLFSVYASILLEATKIYQTVLANIIKEADNYEPNGSRYMPLSKEREDFYNEKLKKAREKYSDDLKEKEKTMNPDDFNEYKKERYKKLENEVDGIRQDKLYENDQLNRKYNKDSSASSDRMNEEDDIENKKYDDPKRKREKENKDNNVAWEEQFIEME
jgi:hypothetical protein